MENPYQKLMNTIRTPDGLNDRVLLEARRRTETSEAKRARRGHPFLRLGLCAVCALALLLGGFTLRSGTTADTESAVPPLSYSFGLTAYAASTGESYEADDSGSIALSLGEGCVSEKFGDFTGCLFQITGENIAGVSLSIDRGGLYRYRTLSDLTGEQMAEYRQAMAEDRIPPAAISQRDDGTWYMPEMTALGAGVQEDYDPEVRYGFWLSPEDAVINEGLGITVEAQMDADFFDGGLLSVTVTFTDGMERTQVYRLYTGSLKVEFLEDNTIVVLPELAGPADSFVYGICAVREN